MVILGVLHVTARPLPGLFVAVPTIVAGGLFLAAGWASRGTASPARDSGRPGFLGGGRGA